MNVIQIVPQFPPAINGLGDYSFLLAAELRARHGINSRIVVGDPTWKSSVLSGDFRIERVCNRSAASLVKALEVSENPKTAVLHYVGYGYAKRGAPTWLINGLSRWKERNGNHRLTVVFHELFAFGPPWRSSFWTSPVQRWAVRRLVSIMDEAQTPMHAYANRLQKFLCAKKVISVSPVFSNVGESQDYLSLNQRRREIVVFGSLPIRMLTYIDHRDALLRACSALNVAKIVDIGPNPERIPTLPVPILKMGIKPAEDVHAILSESFAGYLSYFDGSLAKSGIFAAYCAHGMLPVLSGGNSSDLDGVCAGIQYMAATDIVSAALEIHAQRIADSGHAWYEEHSIPRTAATLAAVLKNPRTATNAKAFLDYS